MVPRYNRTIVNDVVFSIVSNSRLRAAGKWASLSPPEVALKQRYDFGDHLELMSMLMSRVMTGLVPSRV